MRTFSILGFGENNFFINLLSNSHFENPHLNNFVPKRIWQIVPNINFENFNWLLGFGVRVSGLIKMAGLSTLCQIRMHA